MATLTPQDEAIIQRLSDLADRGSQQFGWDHPEIKDMIDDIRKAKIRSALSPRGVVIRIDLATRTVNISKVGAAPVEPAPAAASVPAKVAAPPPSPKKPGLRSFAPHTYHNPAFHEDMKRAIADAAGLIVCGVGPTGSGKCVDENTLVVTGEGIKAIKDFQQNHPAVVDGFNSMGVDVSGVNGTEKSAFFYNGGVKKTWTVKTRQGYELTGTTVHRLVSVGDAGPEWRRLPDFKVGERVLIKSSTELYGNKPHGLPLNGTDFDVGYVIGFWVGEGCIGYRPRKTMAKVAYDVIFSIGQDNDQDFLCNFVRPLIQRVSGKNCRRGDDSRGHSASLVFCNRQIAEWLAANCGCGAENKKVPNAVLEGTKDIQIGFLSGYMDADGGNNNGSEIEMGTNSESLAKTLRIMLLNMGVVSSLKQRPTTKAWRIFIRGRWMRKFLLETKCRLDRKYALANSCGKWSEIDTLPFFGTVAEELYNALKKEYTSKKQPAKDVWTYKKRGKIGRAFLKRDDVKAFVPVALADMAREENFWDEVVSVEESGERQVYDLSVPGTNSFVAGGFMNHNTCHLKVVAEELNMEFVLVNCHRAMEMANLTGEKTVEPDETTKAAVIKFLHGPIVKAMRSGLDKDGNEGGKPAILVLDEYPALPAWCALGLNSLLETRYPRRSMMVAENGGEHVLAHSGFRIVLLGNTIGRGITMETAEYTAQGDALDISTLDRVSAIFNYGYSKTAEERLLAEKIGDDAVVRKIVQYRDAIRKMRREQGMKTPLSTRLLVHLADAYRVFGGDIGKALLYSIINKTMPHERPVYIEQALLTFGVRIEKITEASATDYDY